MGNPKRTDQEILELFEAHGRSATALAPILGCNGRKAREKVAMAKLRLNASPQMIAEQLSPEVENLIQHELKLGSIPLEGSRISSAWVKGEHLSVHLIPMRPDEALVAEPYATQVHAYPLTGVRDPKTLRTFIVGDQQMGFWAVLDPENPMSFRFVPFHDERCQDIMMKAMALYAPDVVVIVGDYFDFQQLSRFQQEPEAAQTMQATVSVGEALIAKIRKTVGDKCRIIFIPGNHETRMQRTIVNNIPSLYNLRRPGEKYALYSVPSLLRFEEHGVECMDEYPSGQFWLWPKTGNLPGIVVTHADPRKSDMRADSIHGHLVLPGQETFAREYQDGWVTYSRLCVSGCGNYSDTGDKVRLTRTNTPSGRARMASVPSFGTVDIDRKTGQRAYGLHLIRDNEVRFLGKTITSSLKKKVA